MSCRGFSDGLWLKEEQEKTKGGLRPWVCHLCRGQACPPGAGGGGYVGVCHHLLPWGQLGALASVCGQPVDMEEAP